jgi:tetratricopeptide (TPR) repeat protein
MRFLGMVFLVTSCALAQDEKPLPTVAELEMTAQASFLKGDYDAGRQSLLTAWQIAQQLPAEDPLRYDVLKRLAMVRAAVGEFADADKYLQMALAWREQDQGFDNPKIVDDVLLSVTYARGMKDFDRALQIMTTVVRLHRTANISGGASLQEAMNSATVADDFSRIAQIQMELKNPEAAIGSLHLAIGIRTKLAGPLDPSLSYDLDRLGELEITMRAYDKAEEASRHALVIRETLYGKTHADLIATESHEQTLNAADDALSTQLGQRSRNALIAGLLRAANAGSSDVEQEILRAIDGAIGQALPRSGSTK